MDLNEIKRVLREHRSSLEVRYHVSALGIFGAYVRNEEADGSDLGILVDFTAPISLFQFIDLEEELSGLLCARVDLVARGALKPYSGKRILSEVQIV